MKDRNQYQTLEKQKVCIHLKPQHYVYLKYLSRRKFHGNISKTILYLLSKYLKYLYKIKQPQIKRKTTATYQPKTKEYKKYIIFINPTYWAKLNHLRNYLGYSMSFIIRITLDWEMSNETTIEEIIILKPHLEPHELLSLPQTLLYSYIHRVRVNFVHRKIFMDFYDCFY